MKQALDECTKKVSNIATFVDKINSVKHKIKDFLSDESYLKDPHIKRKMKVLGITEEALKKEPETMITDINEESLTRKLKALEKIDKIIDHKKPNK